jgi:CheY-like chemotaxis protein
MVQGFAAQSEGTVRISSRLGEGSTVELWLPRAEDDLSVEPIPEKPFGLRSERQRQGHILVCDDDSDVRSLIGGILRDLGHAVLRRRRPRPSDRWHLDEMVVRIAGQRMYLWRAVDHEGEVLDMLVERRRDSRAALRLMARRLQRARRAPP